MRKIILFFLAFEILCAQPVVSLRVVGKFLSESQIKLLENELCDLVLGYLPYTILETVDIDILATEMRRQLSGLVDDPLEMGNWLGASHMLIMNVMPLENSYRINLKYVDIEKAETLCATSSSSSANMRGIIRNLPILINELGCIESSLPKYTVETDLYFDPTLDLKTDSPDSFTIVESRKISINDMVSGPEDFPYVILLEESRGLSILGKDQGLISLVNHQKTSTDIEKLPAVNSKTAALYGIDKNGRLVVWDTRLWGEPFLLGAIPKDIFVGLGVGTNENMVAYSQRGVIQEYDLYDGSPLKSKHTGLNGLLRVYPNSALDGFLAIQQSGEITYLNEGYDQITRKASRMSGVSSIVCSDSRRDLYLGGEDGRVQHWQVSSSSANKYIHDEWVTPAILFKDMWKISDKAITALIQLDRYHLLLLGDENGKLYLFDIINHFLVKELSLEAKITAIELLDRDRILVSTKNSLNVIEIF